MNLSTQLELNMQYLDDTFKDCGDIVKRKLPIGANMDIWIYISYIDMLIDTKTIEMNIVSKLMAMKNKPESQVITISIFDALKDGGITTADLSETEKFEDINMAILSGDTVILVDGFSKAIIVSTKGWPNRGIPTAEIEVSVQGSQEAFSEGFRFNTALIRRRIRDTNLKLKQMKIGRRSGTDIGIMYLEDVVRPKILREAEKRLKNIDIDAILDCGYIDQLIEDDWMSPLPQTQITERPDKAASAILEGRIVIVVDNSPFVIIIPATFNAFFQASDDYYQNWKITSCIRFLRYVAGFIAVALPGLYLATAVFHPSMIPMLLTFKMAAARQMVPFPAIVEILIMEAAFELLQEAGLRLPKPVGGSIGIVGGLIVGQAAVEAGLVSPIVVIVIALTGIASFSTPHYSLSAGFRIMKYLITVLSAMLGFFGFWAGILIILIHMVSLKSFGIPYLFPFASGDINGYSDWKDSIFRLPLFLMKKRPFFANPSQTDRLQINETGNEKWKE